MPQTVHATTLRDGLLGIPAARNIVALSASVCFAVKLRHLVIDKLILTTSSTYLPSGTGPTEVD
jgi:hypothetical protein